ncbi:MAG TPA: flavodoxin family protein, partial [Microthrixaceae bacterium]|nr:flavodoxin family protein [Microthrixaceae bacterium]
MRALVIHESLTGNTRTAARTMVAELQQEGWEASECSSRQVDLAALQQSDVVIVGTWVDGLVLFGQRPGGAGKLAKLP